MSRGIPRLRGIARAPEPSGNGRSSTTSSTSSTEDAGPSGARKRENHHFSFARPLGAIAVATLLAVAGALSPMAASPAAAALNTKVVIIVGPVGDATTADYIGDANAAAAVARKYTSNVITIYSPHATWAAVSKAMAGANIVLYLGHGNGFPSPYSSTLNKTSMNGFGLNARDNAGNYNWTYYGENYITQVKLAPNAVVLFSRLCYASGNNEWGAGIPSLSVAAQRVDNYAAAFITSGARAVIADGLGDIGWYIGQLFTRHSTIDNLFRNAPNRHNNYQTFRSTRHAGYGGILDVGTYSYVPDRDPYYRSMVSVALSTDAVVGSTGSTSAATTGLVGKTTYDAVNLRSSASTGASLVKTLANGTSFTVLSAIVADGTGRTWAKVRTSTGITGYLATAYATFSGPAAATTTLNMRSSPSTSATVTKVLAAGARFTVTGSRADASSRSWFSVRLSTGATGWVASWFVKP